jgi:hypothetical protein
MNRDIYFIIIRNLFEAFFKIFHIFDQQRPRKCKIFFLILTIINNMNHYFIIKIGLSNYTHKVRISIIRSSKNLIIITWHYWNRNWVRFTFLAKTIINILFLIFTSWSCRIRGRGADICKYFKILFFLLRQRKCCLSL